MDDRLPPQNTITARLNAIEIKLRELAEKLYLLRQAD